MLPCGLWGVMLGEGSSQEQEPDDKAACRASAFAAGHAVSVRCCHCEPLSTTAALLFCHRRLTRKLLCSCPLLSASQLPSIVGRRLWMWQQSQQKHPQKQPPRGRRSGNGSKGQAGGWILLRTCRPAALQRPATLQRGSICGHLAGSCSEIMS